MAPSTEQYPRVQRYGINKEGRDFIASDLHGAFTTLVQAMRDVHFDPNVDRLFIDGDMVDRGAESARTAKFVKQHYVKPLAGNHEKMLIDLYKDGEPDEAVLRFVARHNGFGWWLTTPDDVRQEILTEIRKLPYVIEIETERGLVGMVHADVPSDMDWQTFVREIEAGNEEVIQVALWGRERVAAMDGEGRPVNGGKPNNQGIKGIDRVFVGHTVQWNGVNRFGNVYAIDTGAIFGETGRKKEGRLTMAELACQTQVLIKPKPPVLIDLRVDNLFEAPKVPNTTPFGQYAL